MNSITKERIELFIKDPLENGLTRGEQMELARIALASLEAEPVAWKVTFTQIDREYNTFTGMYSDKAEVERWVRLHKACNFRADITPLYTAQQVPVTPDGWISCSERMPVIGELNWRTSFPLLVMCEIGVIPAYYGFVSVNGDRHYGFMESLKYGDDNGNHPQTNEYGLISNVTHWMPLPERRRRLTVANLQLAVKGEYFDAMIRGEKTEEYRLCNNYWNKRIMFREYDRLIITKGYPKRDDSSRRIDVPYDGYEIKTITHPHFGDKPVKVFAIKVNIGNE
ncbi:TPA: DUF551 domain-containing protein [Escherichia coli]|nr:DUF551 domain-containing protein [Escherichia coli]HAW1880309.1 DUF551 domain-containing protein [Escherichia coli]